MIFVFLLFPVLNQIYYLKIVLLFGELRTEDYQLLIQFLLFFVQYIVTFGRWSFLSRLQILELL